MDEPLVSIIMNCYNGEEYLPYSIESVIIQNYKNWELIFWDNCSTDNSPNIIKSYSDIRIKYFKSENNTSLGIARNLAILNSKGEYIAFLDTDDIWLPDKLKIQIEIMLLEKGIGFIYTNYISFWSNGEFVAIDKSKISYQEDFSYLIKNYNVGMSTALVRKSIVDSNNIIFDEKFSLVEDYDYFLNITYLSKAYYCADLLVKYRMHANSLTHKFRSGWAEELYELHNKFLDSLDDKDLINYSNELNWIKVRAINSEIMNYLHDNKKMVAFISIVKNIHYSYKLFILILGVILGYNRFIKIANLLSPKNYRI